MSTAQIQTLLKDSSYHYRNRNLKKALNTAQIALDFGLEEGAAGRDLIQANILLARIYYTNGQYQCEPSFFLKALQNLEEANRLNQSEREQPLEIDILLEYGRILQHQGNFKKAETFLDRAFKVSQKDSNTAGIVLSLAALSQLCVLKNDFEKAFDFVNDGLTFLKNSEAAEDTALLAEVYGQLSQVLIKRKDYSQSLEPSQALLELSRNTGDVEKELTALKNIAIVCGVKSNYKIGMQYFLDALDKSEEIGYRQNIVHILINIGTIYAHLFNYKEAINRYSTVLEEHDDILDERDKAVIFNNLGNINYSIEAFESANDYFLKSLELSSECGYHEMVAQALAQLARTEIRMNRYEEARAYATKAQALISELGNINGKQINLLNLGKLAFLKEQFDEAIILSKKSIETASLLKDDAGEIRAFKLLAAIYKAKGDFKNALEYQILLSKSQEAFAKTQRNRQFLDMEIRHAIKEKQKEIEQLTKENEYQALLIEQSDQIAQKNEELLRANEELSQFAYVASHDLKEPLRMISSYAQVLDRKLKDKLDQESQEYFNFITDGASRMNNLLDALLRYATVGKSDEELELIAVTDIIEIAKMNLKVRIEETNASIIYAELPKIKAYSSQLTQLFQNLIGNALKFSKPDVLPIIQISAQVTDAQYIFCVKDNGIGIPEQSRKRVFEIFQRLHGRSQYEGTGIGLAICQKIVQRMGGKIWVESQEGEGAAFYFSVLR